MKEKKAYKYLVLIPIINLFLYLLHASTIFSDIALGVFMGIGTGLSVLIIYMSKKNFKKPKSLKENIKKKWIRNNS